MNRQLDLRNRFLEAQLALYTSCPVDEVVQNAGLGLNISDRGSPSSFGVPSSPASTQSEPVKTEEQDDIDQIIAPTRHLHVRIVLHDRSLGFC